MTEEDESRTWHSIDEQTLMRETGSGERGLGSDEVRHRLERFGSNELSESEGTTAAGILLRQFHNPLIYLLAGAAALSLATGHSLDAGVILAVILLNTFLGAVQEWKADRALEALRELSVPHATVLREGSPEDVSSADVVPGDILLLETGDRVPADARVLGSSDLRADESALTGESEPVLKEPGSMPEETQLGDRTNMVWMSSAIVSGRGRAVVVETGMETELGRIAGAVRSAGGEKTPLQKRMDRLGVFLGAGGVALALVVFLLGVLKDHPVAEMALFAVAVAVSAIPEGLPAVISVTLALGVRRMAGQNAVIRTLPAVETLGSTTVICSDKTGTITRNEMTVTHLWTISGEAELSASDVDRSEGCSPEDMDELHRAGILVNNASMDGAGEVSGTPTETAILTASTRCGPDPGELERLLPRLDEIPFGSDHKYMATLHGGEGSRGGRVYVKGAPDRILEFSDRILEEGEAVPLDDRRRRAVLDAMESYGDRALRLVAAAYGEMPEGSDGLRREDVEGGLVLIGLWGMVDPPRAEAVSAIADAQSAGIRVVMITGDHARTAEAIAGKAGIAGHGERTVTGAELDEMTDGELEELVGDIAVYARVSPKHKLRILEALRRSGEIVAMTGDGVNDAPALKGADIGISMGDMGTEVAREASDMVLTDDDFATIMHAVEEGRTIFSNLRRVVFFLLTTNLGEIITLAAALLIGLPLPLTAVMILWINLVTDGACTVPLGIEPRHRSVLKAPPRSPDAGILDRYLVRRVLILAPVMAAGTLLLFKLALDTGSGAHARTMAFTVLAAYQWYHALNARSSTSSVFSIGLFSNLWLWGGILLAMALQVLVVHTRAGRTLFGLEPLGLADWGLVAAAAASIFAVDELLKMLGAYGKRREGAG